MKNKFYTKIYFLNVLIIFLLAYYPAYHIPLHSDDYSYFLKGNSLDAHLQHYLTWSGRFITDYISSILLNYFNKPVYMAINSLVLIVMLVAITSLPRVVIGKNLISKNSWLILWLVFITYWVSNPNLGQTTFWLVGSANYLWTIMWASLYLLALFLLLNEKSRIKTYKIISLIILGLFAGLSNESTGVSIVFFTIILFFIYKDNRKLLLTALLSSSIGFALLYFAPGNFVRLAHPAFTYWIELPIYEKIYIHLFERIPNTLSLFWVTFITIIIMFCLLSLWDINKKKNRNLYLLTFIFLIISIFSILVFIKAPYMMPRAKNTALYFLLITLSFLANRVDLLNITKSTYSLVAIITLNAIYFIPSYVLFSYAINKTSMQAEIREEIISNAKANGRKDIVIPDWYFTRLVKYDDRFDMYRSEAMPQYYNVNHIYWIPAKFDYSVIKTTSPILSDIKLKDNLTLNGIYYSNGYKIFDDNKLILGFNQNPSEYAKNGENILYIHLYTKNNVNYINKDMKLDDFMEINGVFYYSVNLGKMGVDEIRAINFGFYNSITNQNAFSSLLEFK